MKILILLSIFLTIAIATETIKNESIKPRYLLDGSYETRIDHFRPQDIRKVKFPYKLNLAYYNPGGPLFFYINDVAQYETKWLEEGLMVDIAQELNAALFTSNHRFFGESLPTETASFSDLQYLSVEQALADIATFVHTAKEHMGSPNARIILYGTNYGAKLAVWARQLYPHLIDAVWSSSGIFVPEPISLNFYNNLSWNIIYRGGTECADRVQQTFAVMEYVIDSGTGEFLQDQLHLCAQVNASSEYDIAMFFESQIEFINEFINQRHIFGIHEFCRDMNAEPNSPFVSYARWFRFRYGSDLECIDVNFQNRVELLQNELWNQPGTNSGNRQTIYGQCTQLGYMKITSESDLFPNRITAQYQFSKCEQILGDDYLIYKLTEATRALNIYYGGRNQQATQIVFTNGLLNPWIYDGITQYDGTGSYVYNMQFSSAGADMESRSDLDSTELRFTKNRVAELITGWALGS